MQVLAMMWYPGFASSAVACDCLSVCLIYRLFFTFLGRTKVYFAFSSTGCIFKFQPFWTLFDRFLTVFKLVRKTLTLRARFRFASTDQNSKMVECASFSKSKCKHCCLFFGWLEFGQHNLGRTVLATPSLRLKLKAITLDQDSKHDLTFTSPPMCCVWYRVMELAWLLTNGQPQPKLSTLEADLPQPKLSMLEADLLHVLRQVGHTCCWIFG